MSTTVNYKGNTITTVNNQTKVLSTGGTWLEGDITLVDVTSGGATSIEDVPNATGTTGVITGIVPEYGTKTITENGTYAAEDDNLDGYSEVTVNVSGGGSSTDNDVNFYDYDGTLLHSYSASDAAALTAMPSNPSHSGLTAQGWNYTLSEMKAEVTAKGSCDIGQMYVTDDDKTRLYCHFETGRLHPYLGLCPNGTVTVDWGDGSATETMTGTSLNAVITIDHEYAAEGDYIITLAMENGTFAFYGSNNTSYVLRKDATTTAYIHRVYTRAIRKVELGSAARIGNYGFNCCYNLKTITMHDAVTIGNYAFTNCNCLTSINIPSGVTSIGSSAFNACNNLTSIDFPSSYTGTALNQEVRNCYSLATLTIPATITSIAANTFAGCYGIAEYHFRPTTPPTLASTNAFANIQSDCIIYVPQGCLEAYQTATNWSTYAGYMREEANA